MALVHPNAFQIADECDAIARRLREVTTSLGLIGMRHIARGLERSHTEIEDAARDFRLERRRVPTEARIIV